MYVQIYVDRWIDKNGLTRQFVGGGGGQRNRTGEHKQTAYNTTVRANALPVAGFESRITAANSVEILTTSRTEVTQAPWGYIEFMRAFSMQYVETLQSGSCPPA